MVARRVQEQEYGHIQTKKRIQRLPMRITFGEKVIALFIIVGFLISLGLVVHHYVSIYSTNKEIYQLEQAIGEQTEKNGGLSLQVIELSAPDRILHIAQEELGMTLDDNKVRVVQN